MELILATTRAKNTSKPIVVKFNPSDDAKDNSTDLNKEEKSLIIDRSVSFSIVKPYFHIYDNMMRTGHIFNFF